MIYRNRLPIQEEGNEGDMVGVNYQGKNMIGIKFPDKWRYFPAFEMEGKNLVAKFDRGGAIKFRNAWNEDVVTIDDNGLETHIS